eukprot:2705362-Pleurochrysis_carterae.AAC.1
MDARIYIVMIYQQAKWENVIAYSSSGSSAHRRHHSKLTCSRVRLRRSFQATKLCCGNNGVYYDYPNVERAHKLLCKKRSKLLLLDASHNCGKEAVAAVTSRREPQEAIT